MRRASTPNFIRRLIPFTIPYNPHARLELRVIQSQQTITPYVTLMNPPLTPGEILLEDYLGPMGISQNAMARAIGVPPRAINEIVLGKRAISPAMSIRFGTFFGQSEGFWHGLQVECDFRALSRERRRLIAKVTPAKELVSTA